MTTATLPPREADDGPAARGQAAVRGLATGFTGRLQRLPVVARVVAVVAAIALTGVGCYLPWGTYAGFPGDMDLYLQYAFPGGSRLYCLILAVTALLMFVPVRGRRRAGMALMLGLAVVALQTLWAIAADGNSLATVQVGAYLTLLAGLVGIAAFAMLPAEADTHVEPPVLPWWADILVLLAAYAAGLGILVYTLALGPANQFLGLGITVIAGFSALTRLGVVAMVSAAAGRRSTISYGLLALVAVAFPLTQNGDEHWLNVAAQAAVFAGAAMGLNVVVGLAGLLDLGYVAFFGIGGYVAGEYGGYAQIGPSHGHIPFLVVLPLAAIVAGFIGVVIGAPTLRLRGDYLAIVTLGFGEIFNQVVNNSGFSGGAQGIGDIPDLGIGGFSFGAAHTLFGIPLPYFANYYYGGLVLVVVLMFLFSRLTDSRIGRAWVAIREDETAAAASGINTTALKLLAFGIGAFLAGAAGSLNAHENSAVTPDQFMFLNSALLLAAVVLGGMGSVGGAVVGSLLLFVIPEKLRPFGDLRLLLFGVALVLMMRFRPEGIIVNRRRAREFHEPAGDDALSAPPGSGR